MLVYPNAVSVKFEGQVYMS